jgi:hypothetical protein
MRPTYVEPKWRDKIFDGIKNLPQQEKEVFKTQGSAIFQEKTKGLDEQRALNSANSIVNYLLTSDPETAPHFQRMMKFGYNPMSDIQNTVKAAVDQYKNESVTLSNYQANPNVLTPYQQRSLAVQERNAATSEMNALNRGSDGKESKGTGVRFEKLPGVGGSTDRFNVWKGTTKYNTGWKQEIINKLSKGAEGQTNEDIQYLTPEDIVLLDADTNTGELIFRYNKEGFDAKEYKIPSEGLEEIISLETTKPPAKTTVKAAPKGNVDKNNPYLKK